MASVKRKETKKGEVYYLITVSMGRDSQDRQLFERTTYHPKAKTPRAIEKEVDQYAKDFENRVKNGEYYDGEKMTFRTFAETWKEEWAVSHLTKSVLEGYLDTLERHIFPEIGNLIISKITPLRCQTIIRKLMEAGKKPKTVKRIFTAMRSVFVYAYRMNIIEENPCDRCELPRECADVSLHYFTLDQAKRFLNVALTKEYTHTFKAHLSHNKITKEEMQISEYKQKTRIPLQFRVLFTLAIIGGFRRGELLGLTWSDIDEENHTISINKALANTKDGQILKEPKTKKSIRLVTMPIGCFDLLADWKAEQRQKAHNMGSAWQGKHGKDYDDNFIFIQDNGLPMNLYTPTHKFKEVIDMYNSTVKEDDQLPIIRFHDLRHTSATLLLSENVDIATISHRLGHSRPSITLDVYSHSLFTKDITASKTLSLMFNN